MGQSKKLVKVLDITPLASKSHPIDSSFKPSQRAVEAYRAALADNVALIRELDPGEHAAVKELIWNCIMSTGDMYGISAALHEVYGLPLERAADIARHQWRLAAIVMGNVRQTEVGITHATWVHSGLRCDNAPEHAELDGMAFDIAKGVRVGAKTLWPGSEIGCRCVSQPLVVSRDAQPASLGTRCS